MQRVWKQGILSAVVALAGMVGAANGAVVFNDTFTYPDGALLGNGGWTITGTSVVNPLQVSSGQVPMANTGQDAYSALSSSVSDTDGNSIYTAVTMDVSAAKATGDYFLHLSDPAGTTFGFYQRLYVQASGSGYVLGLLDTSGTGSATTFGSGVLNLNQDYNVVVAWNFVAGGANNDTFSVYVNPTDLSVESNNAAYLTHTWTSTGTAEPAQLSAVNLRQGGSTTGSTVTVDNLVVATSFAEANGVPEPASLGLLMGAGLLFVRRRRA